jgi:hypothetical protein
MDKNYKYQVRLFCPRSFINDILHPTVYIFIISYIPLYILSLAHKKLLIKKY